MKTVSSASSTTAWARRLRMPVLAMSSLKKTESPAETSGQSNESLRANSRQGLLVAATCSVASCAAVRSFH